MDKAALPKDIFTPNIETAKKLIDLLVEFMVKYSFHVLGGVVILVVGFFIAKLAGKAFDSFLRKNKVDITIAKFLVQILNNEAAQLRMLDGLSDWQGYFYRGNAWSNAQSGADVAAAPATPPVSAPVSARAQLPTGVRTVLGFGGGAGALAGNLTRDVLLAPQMP